MKSFIKEAKDILGLKLNEDLPDTLQFTLESIDELGDLLCHNLGDSHRSLIASIIFQWCINNEDIDMEKRFLEWKKNKDNLRKTNGS